MPDFFVLGAIGLGVGAAGTLIGAGGGFLMVPLLLYLYPHDSPETVTAISLSVVFCNSLSGSIAYAIRGRINYQAGIIFSLASIPGAILGVEVVKRIQRETFEPIFASALILVAGYLLIRPDAKERLFFVGEDYHKSSESLRRGTILSLFVGFVSSFLGIGGGIIHVPALTHLLGFSVHIATATSHFVLAATSFVGASYHYLNGDLKYSLGRVGILGIGALVGAQFGAHLSEFIEGKWIIRTLAAGLLMVGFRIIFVRLS